MAGGKALTERGVTRIILTGRYTSYHGALTARSVYAAVVRATR